MNIDEILNTPRTAIDPDKIELPETEEQTAQQTTENGEKNGENTTVSMSPAQLANMAIGVYNAIQTAVYKRIEPRFDASLTPEETQALLPPTEAVLAQYNVQMSPVTCLVVTIVGINMGKIMQLKMLQAQWKKEEAAKEAENTPYKVVEQKTAGSVEPTPAPATEQKTPKKTAKK